MGLSNLLGGLGQTWSHAQNARKQGKVRAQLWVAVPNGQRNHQILAMKHMEASVRLGRMTSQTEKSTIRYKLASPKLE